MTKRNGLKKMPLSRIKDMVKYGSAKRVQAVEDVPSDCAQIGFSVGTNGVNGYLFKGESGKLYVCLNSIAMFSY